MNKKLFILAILMQVGLLGTMIAGQENLLKNGKKIMLKCKALDPRSLFSGDYVELNYEISEINLSVLQNENSDFSSGDTVFVSLKKNKTDSFFSVNALSKTYSEDTEGTEHTVTLKGKVQYVQYRNNVPGILHVKYGIETYFVPQNEGKHIENNMKHLYAEISVKDKKCALSKLFLSGLEIKFY